MAYCALNIPYWAIIAAFYFVSTIYYCSITVHYFCIIESSATTIFMPSLLPIVLWLCPMCHHSVWLWHHCAIWRHHNDLLCHNNILLFLPNGLLPSLCSMSHHSSLLCLLTHLLCYTLLYCATPVVSIAHTVFCYDTTLSYKLSQCPFIYLQCPVLI